MKPPHPKDAEPVTAGLRYNKGKPRYDLVPPAAYKALAVHFGQGAKKYADRNWEKGLDIADIGRAIESHLTEWKLGHSFDREDPAMPGYRAHHLIAIIWNAAVLYEHERRQIGGDTRAAAQFGDVMEPGDME